MNTLDKIKFKIQKIIKDFFYEIRINFVFYRCYWLSKTIISINKNPIYKNYLSIKVHPGAGIGHQLSNYNSGIWFSSKFKLNHCHIQFPNKKWEKLLYFYKNSKNHKKLIKNNYKIVQLPKFDEFNLIHLKIIKKIVNQYHNQKTLFLLEYDQSYKAQFKVKDTIKFLFFNKRNLNKDRNKLVFNKKFFNIALHYRSGDILNNKKLIKQRLLDNEYYFNAIKIALRMKPKDKNYMIYIFSEGHNLDFFLKKNKINFQDHPNVDQYNTFINFIYADILITSKSSYSYNAGLISQNIKISPKSFWHDYPKDKNWIVLNDF